MPAIEQPARWSKPSSGARTCLIRKSTRPLRKPRNVGAFEKGDDTVGTGMVGAPACGDVMKLQIKVGADGVIEDAKFKTYGCGSAIASSSLVTEWVKGKTLDEALSIKNTQIAEELALPPVKIHCSILAEDAIKAAVQDYKAKHGANRSRLSGLTARQQGRFRFRKASIMAITLTEKAAKHISRYMERRGKGIGLRLGVRTTGCSGLATSWSMWMNNRPKTPSSSRMACVSSSIPRACPTSTAPSWTSRAKA
jgi:nitrogen fixation NifU-like protein